MRLLLLLHTFTPPETIRRGVVDLRRQIQFTPPSLLHLEGFPWFPKFPFKCFRFSRNALGVGEYTDFGISIAVTLVTFPVHNFTL